jgi:hypothetical protein
MAKVLFYIRDFKLLPFFFEGIVPVATTALTLRRMKKAKQNHSSQAEPSRAAVGRMAPPR